MSQELWCATVIPVLREVEERRLLSHTQAWNLQQNKEGRKVWSGREWRQEREYWERERGTEGKHIHTEDIPVLLLLKYFHLLFQDVSWVMGMGIGLQRHLLGLDTPSQLLSVFWLVVTFCSGFLCKTKILSRRGRTAVIFGVRNPSLEWSYKFHWFGKITVEGSSCWMYFGFN